MAEENAAPEEELEEPVSSTETDESETETEEETEQETQPEQKEEKTYTQEQLNEIVSKRLAREKRKLQREKVEKPLEAKESPDKQGNPPKLEDFETTEEYLDARADWRVEQRLKADAQKAEAEKQAEAHARLKSKYEKQQVKMSVKYDDYDDLMDDMADLDIPPYISEAVMDSDIGGELSYFLGKNPEELEKILDMQPLAAVKALGRIESKLESSSNAKKEVSKAPA